MSTCRFPWRGTIGLVGSYNELTSRIWAKLTDREKGKAERPLYSALEVQPSSEALPDKLPVAHRYSA